MMKTGWLNLVGFAGLLGSVCVLTMLVSPEPIVAQTGRAFVNPPINTNSSPQASLPPQANPILPSQADFPLQAGLSSQADLSLQEDPEQALRAANQETHIEKPSLSWREQWNVWLEQCPSEVRILLRQGWAAHGAGAYGRALAHYQRAWELAPECKPVLASLGLGHASLFDFSLAIHYYQAFLQLEANFFPVYNNLAFVYARDNRPLEGEALLRKAKEIGLDASEDWYIDLNLGTYAYHRYAYDEALEFYAGLQKLEKGNKVEVGEGAYAGGVGEGVYTDIDTHESHGNNASLGNNVSSSESNKNDVIRGNNLSPSTPSSSNSSPSNPSQSIPSNSARANANANANANVSASANQHNNSTRADYHLGLIAYDTGRYDDAIHFFESAWEGGAGVSLLSSAGSNSSRGRESSKDFVELKYVLGEARMAAGDVLRSKWIPQILAGVTMEVIMQATMREDLLRAARQYEQALLDYDNFSTRVAWHDLQPATGALPPQLRYGAGSVKIVFWEDGASAYEWIFRRTLTFPLRGHQFHTQRSLASVYAALGKDKEAWEIYARLLRRFPREHSVHSELIAEVATWADRSSLQLAAVYLTIGRAYASSYEGVKMTRGLAYLEKAAVLAVDAIDGVATIDAIDPDGKAEKNATKSGKNAISAEISLAQEIENLRSVLSQLAAPTHPASQTPGSVVEEQDFSTPANPEGLLPVGTEW